LENATINKDHLQLYAEDTARGEGNWNKHSPVALFLSKAGCDQMVDSDKGQRRSATA
jgi:hypothetical protein